MDSNSGSVLVDILALEEICTFGAQSRFLLIFKLLICCNKELASLEEVGGC